MTKELWEEVKAMLKGSLGPNNYANWIEPLDYAGCEEGIALFHVQTAFFGNYVDQTFGDDLIGAFRKAGRKVDRLRFDHSRAQRDRVARSGDAPMAARSGVPREDASNTLDERYTFDRFVVGKSNELAHAAAKRVAEGRPVTFNPLFLYSGVGLGKTHLMHAVAHELRARQPELNVIYISAEQFMYRFITALREKKMIDFKQMFRSVDVLMVDDVQFMAGKDSTQEEFFHTFNALVDAKKQIIISADRAPGELDGLEDRIKSRLQCGLIVDLHPTDYELRVGILQSKIDLFQEHYPGLVLQDGVVELLAHKIVSNVRVLEGAMTRLFAFASLVGRDITVELAQDCLSDIFKTTDRKVSVEEIQRRVADHFNIRLADLIGPKRLRVYARPRQIAMYLSKTLTTRSLPEIGRRFGKRDHTTILHGVKNIEKLMQSDSQIADDVELLRRALQA